MFNAKEAIKDYYLFFPILILGFYFVYKLINQSQMIFIFPLDKYNDWSSYMAQLYFLKECGFHNFCSYWYNGFVSFQIAQPGWYLFIYPIYLITTNVQITAFISLILTYVLSFIALYINRNRLSLSKLKAIAFFILFFGNAIAIGNFIRLGKIHELFGWFNLIVIFILLIIYKDKKMDKYFFLIIPFYFFAILSHQNSAIISSLSILGLFLVKKLKERIIIIFSIIITLIATSFWWIEYVKYFFTTTSNTIIVSNSLLSISKATMGDNIATIVVPILFLIILSFYFKSKDEKKKEILFLMPQIILSFLLLTRLIVITPILKYVYPDSYNMFLLFFTIFMLFHIKLDYIKKYSKIIIIGFIIISILSVSFNVTKTKNFIGHTELENETLSILPEVKGRFIILATPSRTTSYPNAYYSYAAIYHNLSSSGGWYPAMKDIGYTKRVDNLTNIIKEENCIILKKELTELNTTEVITYDKYCNILERCGFNKKNNKSRVCLYSIKK